MNHIKNFLGLIEEGDAVTILSEELVVERLNELFKYEFIAYKDGQIFLTEKGKEAKKDDYKQKFIFDMGLWESEYA